ncbi:hypothetical protein EMCRGX_G029184 [Ephydatia muelleri]
MTPLDDLLQKRRFWKPDKEALQTDVPIFTSIFFICCCSNPTHCDQLASDLCKSTKASTPSQPVTTQKTPSRQPMKVTAHRSINSQPVQQSLEGDHSDIGEGTFG